MSKMSILSHLQLVDHELDDKTKRAHQVDEQLASDPNVAAARLALEAAEKKLSAARGALRASELDAASLDAKIKELEGWLYGGRVTNPKELEGLEKDLQMHKRNRSDMDDRLLALMDSVEQALRDVEEKALTLRKIEETRASDVSHLAQEKEALAKRLVELDAHREQARAALDADALRQYDHLRRAKAGRAVAQVKNDSCNMCGVTVPSGLIHRVRAGDEIILCPSCGRILA